MLNQNSDLYLQIILPNNILKINRFKILQITKKLVCKLQIKIKNIYFLLFFSLNHVSQFFKSQFSTNQTTFGRKKIFEILQKLQKMYNIKNNRYFIFL